MPTVDRSIQSVFEAVAASDTAEEIVPVPIVCTPAEWEEMRSRIEAELRRHEWTDEGYGSEFASFLSLVWAATRHGEVVVRREG